MAFFGLFKSKQERDMEETFKKLNSAVFPNGEIDVKRDCARVDILVGGKIPQDKLRAYVAGCKVLLEISESYSDDRFVKSFAVRSEGRISEEEAYAVFAYLDGEASYYDKLARLVGSDNAQLKESLGDLPWIYSEGTSKDRLDKGYGDFGLVASNPIPTVSVRGSQYYLSKLRYQGRQVENIRLGSTKSDVTPGSIDAYKLSSAGVMIGTVYLCPYHKKISSLAPSGFTLI